MRNPITLSLFICFIICNNLYASNVQIKGNVKSNGDIFITGKGNIYITKKYIEGVKPKEYLRLAKEFDVTETVVKNFLKILKQKQVPPEDLDTTFRQIATRHKELQSRLKQFNLLVDPEIKELRKKAEQAINNGDYEAANKYLDEALERQMVCITNAEKQLTNCKLSAAEMKVDKGDIELIRINYKAATKLFKEAVELVPDGHELKKAEYLQKWGDTARAAGLYPESKTALEQCLVIREKLLPNTFLSTTFNNLALLYVSQGKYAEAEPLYKRALDIEKLLGKDHPSFATTLNNLAALYQSQGKYEEAEPLYQRSLGIRETKLGKDHPHVAGTLNNLASLYVSQGKYEEAEPLYKRALDINEKSLGKDHPEVATTLNNLAGLYKFQGKYTEAVPLYKRGLEIEKKALGRNHPSVATTLNNLALLYVSQGKYEETEPLYKRALDINEKSLGKDHPEVATTLNNLAELYASQGKYTEAVPLYKRDLEITEKALGKEHPSVATTLNNLAGLYRSQGKYEEAEPLYQRSLGIRETKLGKDHPSVATTLNNLALM